MAPKIYRKKHYFYFLFFLEIGIPKTGRNLKKTGRRVEVLKMGRLPGKRVDLASLLSIGQVDFLTKFEPWYSAFLVNDSTCTGCPRYKPFAVSRGSPRSQLCIYCTYSVKVGLYRIRPFRIVCRRHPFSYC